jgi:hypothetical protein
VKVVAKQDNFVKRIIKIILFVFLVWVILVTIYVTITHPNRGIKLCLNGGTLSSDSSLVSSGWSKAGPWIIVRNENILYQKLVIRGIEVSSSEELKDVVPDVFVDVISSKVKVDRIEAEIGRYLYIAKKDDLIYIWSVSL